MSKFRWSTIALAVLSFGSAVGCSSASQAPTSTTTTIAKPTTTPAATAPPTTQPARATGSAPSTAQAATQLVDAWNNHDKAAAAVIADAAGVEGIFATPDDSMWLRSCSIDDARIDEGGCIYRTATGLVQINTARRGDGWVVTSVVYDALDNGNETSGPAPDAPPPTTVPEPTTVDESGSPQPTG